MLKKRLYLSLILSLTAGFCSADAYLPIAAGANRNTLLVMETTPPYTLQKPFNNQDNFGGGFSFINDPVRGGLAVSPDGQYIYVVDEGNNRLVILKKGNPPVFQSSISLGYMQMLTSVAVSPDGNRVYVDDYGAFGIYIVDVSDKSAPVLTGPLISLPERPFGIVASPDNSTVYVSEEAADSSAYSGYISIINADTGQDLKDVAIPDGGVAPSLTVSPDGQKVYFPDQQSTNQPYIFEVSVLDAKTQTISHLASLSFDSYPYGIAISPKGDALYVTESFLHRVDLIPLTHPHHVFSTKLPCSPVGVDVAKDGSRVFVSCSSFENLIIINPQHFNQIEKSPSLQGVTAARNKFIN